MHGNTKLILKWKLKILNGNSWNGFIWLKKQVQVVGCCEHGNEPSDSTKCIKFLEWLRNYQLLILGFCRGVYVRSLFCDFALWVVAWRLKMTPTCPETSVTTNTHSVTYQKSRDLGGRGCCCWSVETVTGFRSFTDGGIFAHQDVPFLIGNSDGSRIKNWAHLDTERAVDLGAHAGAVLVFVFLVNKR